MWNPDCSNEMTVTDLVEQGVKFRQPGFSFVVQQRMYLLGQHSAGPPTPSHPQSKAGMEEGWGKGKDTSAENNTKCQERSLPPSDTGMPW